MILDAGLEISRISFSVEKFNKKRQRISFDKIGIRWQSDQQQFRAFFIIFSVEFIESQTKMDVDSCQSTSNHKRQHSDLSSPQPRRKSQRLSNDPNAPLTITDLNDNCLEKIFGYLDLVSMFNVAAANLYLRPAAGVAYKRKFGAIQVCIRNGIPSSVHCSEPHIFHKWIYVDGLKVCLPYLRCLGPSIRDLCVRYDGWTKAQCDLIHQYINEYCATAGNLVNLTLRDKQRGIPIKHFKKPFASVQSVKVQDSHLGAQIPLFSQWFPNMRSLELLAVHIGWFPSQTKPLDHLEDVTIEINNDKRGFKSSLATRLLHLSPQLRSLTIRARTGQGITPTTLAKIIGYNLNIATLKVNTNKQRALVTSSDIEQFGDERKSLVELELVGYRFTVEAALLIIQQLDFLKKLRFEIGSRSDYTLIVSKLESKWQSALHEWFGNFCVKLQC